MNKIVYNGLDITDESDAATKLYSGNIYLSNSLDMEELTVDTLSATVRSRWHEVMPLVSADGYTLVSSDGYVLCGQLADDFGAYKVGAPVLYYRDNAFAGRYYLDSIKRTGAALYTMSAVSAIGLLDKQPHAGGLYNSVNAGDIIADIIGNSVPYTVDIAVANVPLWGWLPYSTRRKNLHQVLFAVGAAVSKDANGYMVFAYPDVASVKALAASDLYTGQTITGGSPYTGARVTEHSWMPISTSEQLIGNTNSTAYLRQIVTFDAPHHDYAAAGLTLHESGANYVVVSGVGTLTGQTYLHNTSITEYGAEAQSTDERVVTCDGATLVSVANSLNVAKRLMGYYGNAATVTGCAVTDGTLKPGQMVELTDEWGEPRRGMLRSVDLTMSATLKADVEIADGYTATPGGNNYTHYEIITNSGTWTPPSGVTRAFLVLLQGGQGGEAGENGADGGAGKITDPADYGEGGAGGSAGSAGAGGKVFSVPLTITNGASIPVSIGAAGAGSTAHGTSGGEGGHTTFGEFSSASGALHQNGYYDILTGTIYGAPGAAGLNGAKGGGAPYISGIPNPSPTPGGDVGTYLHGSHGAYAEGINLDGTYSFWAIGGAGGGAAYGNNGGNGTDGTVNPDYDEIHPGIGGNGADAITNTDISTYGCGGNGGSGGGGGGGGCIGSKQEIPTDVTIRIKSGVGGVGGAGSAGADGAPGAAIIYY